VIGHTKQHVSSRVHSDQQQHRSTAVLILYNVAETLSFPALLQSRVALLSTVERCALSSAVSTAKLLFFNRVCFSAVSLNAHLC
jgi:uncharacterized protein YdaL